MSAPLPDAVIFDFDGLIFDSETPIFQASAAALSVLGHHLDVERWATVVGHGDDDSFRAMERAVGATIDRAAFDEAYEAQDRSWRDRQPSLPGVVELLEALEQAGVPRGVASSSPLSWVETHLERLGLRRCFGAVASRDRVGGRAKPAPDVYLLACRELGADPTRSVALEDSAPGVVSAIAAGLGVVAVPSEITRHTDLSAAHRTVDSLAQLTVQDLADLLAEVVDPSS